MEPHRVKAELDRAAFLHPDFKTDDFARRLAAKLGNRNELLRLVAISPLAAVRMVRDNASAPDCHDLAALSLYLARSAGQHRCQHVRARPTELGPWTVVPFSSTGESFCQLMEQEGMCPSEIIERQVPYLGTAVSLNPKRQVRHFSLSQGMETVIAIRYDSITLVQNILHQRRVFETALMRLAVRQLSVPPVHLAVADDSGCWLVSEYRGKTLLDRFHEGLDSTETIGDQFTHLLALLEQHGLVWGDFSPRNIVVSDDGRWHAIDFERLRGPGEQWTETDYERLYLCWLPVLGQETCTHYFAGGYEPDTLDVNDQSLYQSDRWDTEWLRQECMNQECRILFTRGLKRRLMQISFVVEACHVRDECRIDGHLVCCYLTDHAGRELGVLAHRLLCDAWNLDQDRFWRMLCVFADATVAHRQHFACDDDASTAVLQRVVLTWWHERWRTDNRPLHILNQDGVATCAVRSEQDAEWSRSRQAWHEQLRRLIAHDPG